MSREDVRELMKQYGVLGMERRQEISKPTTDDILLGMSSSRGDTEYQLTRLVSLYMAMRDGTGFSVGDRVRVRKPSVERGNSLSHAPGWYGYAPMFSDETAVIVELEWSPHIETWVALIEFENAYRFSDFRDGQIYLSDRPKSFMFAIDEIKRVKRK